MINIKNLYKIYKYVSVPYNYNEINTYYKNRLLILKKQKKILYKNKRLLGIYDFLDMPYTSDFAIFLINLEIERKINKLEKIDIVLVSDAEFPSDSSYESYVNKEYRKKILYNMIIEYTRILDTIGSIHIFDNRNQIIDFFNYSKNKYIIFPYDYNPKLPLERIANDKEIHPCIIYSDSFYLHSKEGEDIKYFSPPDDQVELARKWIKSNIYPKIPILISLRETTLKAPDRIVNIQEWVKLVKSYEENEDYIFIIVRDYDNIYEKDFFNCKNVIYCNEAILSLSFRAALSENVTLNLFIPNGVNTTSWFSKKSNYIQFKVGIGESSSSKEFLVNKFNFIENGHWFSANKYQKYIWKDDKYETLKIETEKMLELLKTNNKLYPDFYNDKKKNVDTSEIINQPINLKKSVFKNRNSNLFLKVFKFIRFKKKLIYYYYKYSSSFPYLSLNDIKNSKEKKIIIYGAGTITSNIINSLDFSITCIIDRNYSNINNKIFKDLPIVPLEELEHKNFDYILITPKNRELEIINSLINNFKINNNKFIVIDKYNVKKQWLNKEFK
jgi:hypothetical protein